MTSTRTLTKRGFTLVELLVTIGLMALLATLSTTGYYAASRGMADRGAVTDVRSLIRLAMQRALIDNVPTGILFYNQILQQATDDEDSSVWVGTAVAIRMAGRISYVSGDYISDEFADLENSYPKNPKNSTTSVSIPLYRMADVKSGGYSESVSYAMSELQQQSFNSEYLMGSLMLWNSVTNQSSEKVFDGKEGRDRLWCFRKAAVSGNKWKWKVGDIYATEIASLQLPHGYVFGSSVPNTYTDGAKDPVSSAKGLVFNPHASSIRYAASPSFRIDDVNIYAIRPGSDSPQQVRPSITSSDILKIEKD